MTAPAQRPPVRSFHPRRGRISPRKRHALDVYFPLYRLDPVPHEVDLDAVFGRSAPKALEIGFGMGDATAALAATDPAADRLAVDIHTPGIARLAEVLHERGLTNVRIVDGDAVEVLRDMVPDGSLAEVDVFFPDPWPKVRHHRRRLIQPPFAELLARKMAPGGVLHLATDWEDYAAHMAEVLDASPSFSGGPVPRPTGRPVTKYEQEGMAAGRKVTDLRYTRT